MINIRFQTKLLIFLIIHFGIFLYALIFNWNVYYLMISLIMAKVVSYIGNEIGMHRYWSHKSFKTSKCKENIMHLFALPLLCGSTIVYSGIHRQHHAYSDTPKDPHKTGSIFKTLFYIREKDFYINPKFIKDLITCPTHKFLHTHYFTINAIILLLFLCIFGFIITGYFLSIIVVYTFVMIGLVNVIGHMKKYGVRNFETNDNSTNNFWLQLISWNHGLHNNHHRFPSNYRMNVYPNEVDFPGWIIEKIFLKNEPINK